MQSRNKREGKYVGCIRGKHVRSIPVMEENTSFWKDLWGDYCRNDFWWPSTDAAWVLMYQQRGVAYTVYRPRYEGKENETNSES